jgi:hypothetical protein
LAILVAEAYDDRVSACDDVHLAGGAAVVEDDVVSGIGGRRDERDGQREVGKHLW